MDDRRYTHSEAMLYSFVLVHAVVGLVLIALAAHSERHTVQVIFGVWGVAIHLLAMATQSRMLPED